MIEDSGYEGLHRVVGRGSISKFIENLARPHVAQKDLGAQYREAARDAARECEARAVTGNMTKLCVFEFRIEVKGARGKAMADQIMRADKQRLKKRIGKVSPSEMLGIERAIRIQLGIH